LTTRIGRAARRSSRPQRKDTANLVTLLLNNKAQTALRDNKGRTALDKAKAAKVHAERQQDDSDSSGAEDFQWLIRLDAETRRATRHAKRVAQVVADAAWEARLSKADTALVLAGQVLVTLLTLSVIVGSVVLLCRHSRAPKRHCRPWQNPD